MEGAFSRLAAADADCTAALRRGAQDVFVACFGGLQALLLRRGLSHSRHVAITTMDTSYLASFGAFVRMCSDADLEQVAALHIDGSRMADTKTWPDEPHLSPVYASLAASPRAVVAVASSGVDDFLDLVLMNENGNETNSKSTRWYAINRLKVVWIAAIGNAGYTPVAIEMDVMLLRPPLDLIEWHDHRNASYDMAQLGCSTPAEVLGRELDPKTRRAVTMIKDGSLERASFEKGNQSHVESKYQNHGLSREALMRAGGWRLSYYMKMRWNLGFLAFSPHGRARWLPFLERFATHALGVAGRLGDGDTRAWEQGLWNHALGCWLDDGSHPEQAWPQICMRPSALRVLDLPMCNTFTPWNGQTSIAGDTPYLGHHLRFHVRQVFAAGSVHRWMESLQARSATPKAAFVDCIACKDKRISPPALLHLIGPYPGVTNPATNSVRGLLPPMYGGLPKNLWLADLHLVDTATPELARRRRAPENDATSSSLHGRASCPGASAGHVLVSLPPVRCASDEFALAVHLTFAIGLALCRTPILPPVVLCSLKSKVFPPADNGADCWVRSCYERVLAPSTTSAASASASMAHMCPTGYRLPPFLHGHRFSARVVPPRTWMAIISADEALSAGEATALSRAHQAAGRATGGTSKEQPSRDDAASSESEAPEPQDLADLIVFFPDRRALVPFEHQWSLVDQIVEGSPAPTEEHHEHQRRNESLPRRRVRPISPSERDALVRPAGGGAARGMTADDLGNDDGRGNIPTRLHLELLKALRAVPADARAAALACTRLKPELLGPLSALSL